MCLLHITTCNEPIIYGLVVSVAIFFNCFISPSDKYTMPIKDQHKLVWVTSLGGFLEFYDFIIYALMAGYLADQFFPSHNPYSSLLTTFATFSAGYLARPLGGLFFGHMGDRYGRKPTFAATVLIMALSTALIGCLPTYDQVGILAPILLTLLRVLQGFSIGGEIPGAMTYLSETVKQKQGLIMSLLFMALLNGFVFGSLVHSLLLWLLGSEVMADWGWRLPFLFGGSLGACSYLVRKRFHESDLFLKLNQQKQCSQVPAKELFQQHKRSLITGILLILPVAVSMPLLFLFPQGYLTKLLHYDAETVAIAGGIGNFFSSFIIVLVGFLTDQCRRRSGNIRLMSFGCLIVCIFSLPIFTAYTQYSMSVYWVMLFSALVLGGVTGVAPLLVSQLFPTNVRYSGIALAYNISFALFGGLTPVIAMALIQYSNNLRAPAWYLAMSGLAGLLGCFLLKRSSVETKQYHNKPTQ